MTTEDASRLPLIDGAAPTKAINRTDRNDILHPRRVGIKAKLFLAVLFLAGLTAVATAVAWYVFSGIERSVNRVTTKSLPGIVDALSLANKSSEIAITAPALMASRNQAERAFEQAQMSQRTRDLVALIQEIDKHSTATDATNPLDALRAELDQKLNQLNSRISRRLELKLRRQEELKNLTTAHHNFLEAIEPLVDDSVFDLVMTGEEFTTQSARNIAELVDGGVNRIDLLLTLNAEANLAAGLLSEAVQVNDRALIQPIRERFEAAAAAVDRSLSKLTEGRSLQDAAGKFLAFGKGEHSIFEHRIQELKSTLEVSVGNDLRTRSADLRAAHESLLLLLTPLIDDAAFELVLTTEGVTKQSRDAITKLIDEGAHLLHTLLMVRAEGNLAAGLLNQAASAMDASLIQPLNERFVTAEKHIVRSLGRIPSSVDAKMLRSASMALLDIGKAHDGLFALRRDELQQLALAQSALGDARASTVGLRNQVQGLVSAARREAQTDATRSTEAISSGKLIMIIIAGTSFAGAMIVFLNYVKPKIIRPLENITSAMTDLAAGNTSVDIPGRERSDELGRMANALGVFRDTAIKVQKSNLREIRDTRRRLSNAIESISEAFSLYDSEDRLVVCNGKYRSLLYPAMADEIVPGMTFEEIVRRAVERGYIKDAKQDPERWLAERLSRHRQPSGAHIQQRGGRWILVSERKTEDDSTVAVYSDITELKQREQELANKSMALEQLSNQLAKYLSPQVYESIFTGRQEVKVNSQRKKLTVFFSDIAGFTETADRLESEELTHLLNQYLTEMSRIALDYGATIDKYVGDAIVIFFGDPETQGVKEDALACVKMAIAMRDRMQDLDAIWRDAGIDKPLKCRIGINTGFCTVGNFGSEDRMDYTIIGGGVNLASRLESNSTPGEILISYETNALIKEEIYCEERGEISVKGIAYPVMTYQVIDSYDRLGRKNQQINEDYPNLKLSLDLEAMTGDERARAAALLNRALQQVSDTM